MLCSKNILLNLLSLTFFAITSASYATDTPLEEKHPRRYLKTEMELATYLESASPQDEVYISFRISVYGCAHLHASFPNITRLAHSCNFKYSPDLIGCLGLFRHLTHLNLSSNRFEGIDKQALATQLPLLTSLEFLSLSSCHMGFNHSFFLALCSLSQLKDLRLNGNDMRIISTPDSMFFWQSLGMLPKLEYLDISYNTISFYGSTEVISFSQTFVNLKYFSLENCPLKGQNPDFLIRLLGQMKGLQTLMMSHNDLEGNAANQVYAAALRTLPQLSQFYMSSNSVAGAPGYKYPAILPLSANIKELILNGNPLVWENDNALAATLKQCPLLEKLSLVDCNMRNMGARRLADCLPMLSHLRDLDLSINSIEPNGAFHLAGTLGMCTSLQRLTLWTNPIAGKGLDVLTPAIAKLVNLEVLSFSENNIGTWAAINFANNALIHLKQLKELTMEMCDIELSGIVALYSTFCYRSSSYPSLSVVNLRQSYDQDSDKEQLLEICKTKMPDVVWSL